MGRLFVCSELVAAVKALGYVAHGGIGESEGIHLKDTGGGGHTEVPTRPSSPTASGFAEKVVSSESRRQQSKAKHMVLWSGISLLGLSCSITVTGSLCNIIRHLFLF